MLCTNNRDTEKVSYHNIANHDFRPIYKEEIENIEDNSQIVTSKDHLTSGISESQKSAQGIKNSKKMLPIIKPEKEGNKRQTNKAILYLLDNSKN